jgi:hypothetical protein
MKGRERIKKETKEERNIQRKKETYKGRKKHT